MINIVFFFFFLNWLILLLVMVMNTIILINNEITKIMLRGSLQQRRNVPPRLRSRWAWTVSGQLFVYVLAQIQPTPLLNYYKTMSVWKASCLHRSFQKQPCGLVVDLLLRILALTLAYSRHSSLVSKLGGTFNFVYFWNLEV